MTDHVAADSRDTGAHTPTPGGDETAARKVTEMLLTLNEIAPPEAEVVQIAAALEAARAGARRLHAVPEARYAQPALVFRAAPANAADPADSPR